MPVFDFSNASTEKTEDSVCTYTTFATVRIRLLRSSRPCARNSVRQWKHHSCGVFSNRRKSTAFEFQEEDWRSERGHPESGRPFREPDPVAG